MRMRFGGYFSLRPGAVKRHPWRAAGIVAVIGALAAAVVKILDAL